MEWFYGFTNKMAIRYILCKTGIVFATALGGYLATLAIQKLKQRFAQLSIEKISDSEDEEEFTPESDETPEQPAKKKRKRYHRKRRKHRTIKLDQ